MSKTQIHVPDVGSSDPVDVIEISVKVGDTISAEDTIIVLESDKATVEVPAPQGGKVAAISVKVGDRVKEGVTETQGLEARRTVAELKSLGWTPESPLPDEQEVMAFEFDNGERMQYWVGLNNLYVITRYNRSVMYAMVVHQLADLLREARPE